MDILTLTSQYLLYISLMVRDGTAGGRDGTAGGRRGMLGAAGTAAVSKCVAPGGATHE